MKKPDDVFTFGASNMRTAQRPRAGAFSVEITGDDLTIDLRPATLTKRMLEAVAESMKRKLTDAGWRVSGKLIDSIKTVGETIVAAADRLKRDPKLAEKFADVVGDPLDDPKVKEAIEDTIADDMIDVKRGRR